MKIPFMVTAIGIAAATAAISMPLQPSSPGYLSRGEFDLLSVLPPAPRPGDARAEADRMIFRSTRSLDGSPRWRLATHDASERPDDMFRNFSCALGATITPATAPRTATLVRKAAFDTAAQATAAKLYYKRRRPFLIDRGSVCQPIEQLVNTYDYPSGHTTLGWTMATLLAQLAPDRATAILARGRAYGDSRVVCGAHNASAVEAGRLAASATLAAMNGLPSFQADLSAAHREVNALRRSSTGLPKDDRVCTTEADLISWRIY